MKRSRYNRNVDTNHCRPLRVDNSRQRSWKRQGHSRIKLLFSIILLLFFSTAGVEASRSYYEILGIPKTASSKEIKTAYRKKALKHHPDKGGDEEEFKEITKSYEALSDPEKRKLYDAYGEAGVEPGAGPNAGSYGFSGQNPFEGGNPFQSFFGNSGGRNFQSESFSSSFGNNGNIDLSELLKQMMGDAAGFSPGNTQSNFGGGRRGSSFGGNQSSSYTRKVTCSLEDLATGATKKLKVNFQNNFVPEKVYTIKLKPGWKEGTKITYDGKNGIPTMTFVVQQAPHKYLRRDGDDLCYTCWISETQTQGGINVKVPLPTGETWSKLIPKGSDVDAEVIANGEKLVVSNKGMPIKGGPERGNLIVEFRVRRQA